MKKFPFLLFLLLCLTCGPLFGKIIYVKKTSNGLNNGTNWANAFTELATALPTAQYGDEIWVAQGVYSPIVPPSPASSFYMVSGVKLLGGFSGNETTAGQRDWVNNVTALDGTYQFPDFLNTNVIYCRGTDSTTVIDGFSIQNGLAQPPNGAQCDDVFDGHICGGGGVFLFNDNPLVPTFLTLQNCRIIDNNGAYGGGVSVNFGTGSGGFTVKNCYFKNKGYECAGMRVYTGAQLQHKMLIDSCIFEGNESFVVPAFLIINTNKDLNLTVSNTLFRANKATSNGGALSVQQSEFYKTYPVTIDHCTFDANEAGHEPGMPGDGGAILARSVKVTNCIFKNNLAYAGAAINAGNIFLSNSCFYNNRAIKKGGGLILGNNSFLINNSFINNYAGQNGGVITHNVYVKDTIINCLFYGNKAGVSGDIFNNISGHCYVNNSYFDVDDCNALKANFMMYDTLICGANLFFKNTNPLLRDTAAADFRLAACSPLVNQGDSVWTKRFGLYADLAGNDRIIDGFPDIGAYETRKIKSDIQYSNVSCFGAQDGEGAIQPKGGFKPYSYQWSSGYQDSIVTNLTAGLYAVTVQDADHCADTVQFEIKQPQPLLCFAAVSNASGASVADGHIAIQTVSGGTAPYSFTWNTGETNDTLAALLPGNYTVTVTDENECTTSAMYEVKFTTSTQGLDNQLNWILFPNPASNLLHVYKQDGVIGDWEYKIENNQGAVIVTGAFNNLNAPADLTINVDLLNAGFYFLSLQSKTGNSITLKFCKTGN